MTDDTRSPAGSRKPADIRDQAIEALAEALRKAGIAEHHDGTEWSSAMVVYAAGMLYEAINLDPEAKAALAAWLVPGVLEAEREAHRIVEENEVERHRASERLLELHIKYATQPVVADTTEEEKYGPAATARIHASLDARYCFIRNCTLPQHKGAPMTLAAGSEPGGEERHDPSWHGAGVPCPSCIGWDWATYSVNAATPPSSVAERGGLREVVARERGRLAGLPVPGSWHNRWGWEAAIREALRSLDTIDAATPVAATLDVERLARAMWEADGDPSSPWAAWRDKNSGALTMRHAQRIADRYSALASEGGE